MEKIERKTGQAEIEMREREDGTVSENREQRERNRERADGRQKIPGKSGKRSQAIDRGTSKRGRESETG